MSTADDLQSLVTGILAADVEDEDESQEQANEQTLLDSLKNVSGLAGRPRQAEWPSLLPASRELEEFLKSADPKKDQTEIRDRVAYWAVIRPVSSYGRSAKTVIKYAQTSSNVSCETFALLFDFLRDPTEESLRAIYHFVRGFNDRQQIDQEMQYAGAVAHLHACWGDETVERLHLLTATSKPTVKRWIAGASASSSNNAKMVGMASLLLVLEYDCRMSEQEAEEYITEERAELGGKSIFDELVASSSYWNLPKEITEIVQKTYEERRDL